MKSNLLTLVQNTLSAMNSDEVDDIDDTEEARQVARIAEEVFYDLSSMKEWGHKKEIITLEASGDNIQPTRMKLPSNVLELFWVQYDKKETGDTKPNFSKLKYIDPEYFIQRTINLDSNDSNIIEVVDDVQSLTFKVYNDRAPEYYTSFDDEYIWCDSYDSVIDATLQSSKTIAYATVLTTFTRTNTFIPDIPNKDWALYRNLVVTKCFEEIKQMPANQASSMAKRLLVRSQVENGQRINGKYPGVNYGR